MKQALFAALLAAVASSALTLLLAAGPRPEAAGPSAAEFRAIFADLTAELAALRRAAPAGGGGADAVAPPRTILLPPPGSVPASPPETAFAPSAEPGPAAAPVPVPGGEDVPAMEEFVPREERSAIARAPELVERLRGLTRWEESADVRRVWILAGEEAVVGTFGKPDEIYVQDGGQENWIYRTRTGTIDEDGEAEWKDICLTMSRGRLVRVDD